MGVPELSIDEKKHLGEELSDVLIYLLRLSRTFNTLILKDQCEIDLPSAVLSKFEQNRRKYPKDTVYGRSEKYTYYQNKDKAQIFAENLVRKVTSGIATISKWTFYGFCFSIFLAYLLDEPSETRANI